ncbi:hypothetical protein DV738_g11, partial [Chaetothyriales sp. CBS 135597]
MEPREKNWAQEYLINPLTAPQPAEESGPGTSFLLGGAPYTVSPKATPQRRTSNRLSKANNPRRSIISDLPTAELKRSTSLGRPPSYSTSVSSVAQHSKDSRSSKNAADIKERYVKDVKDVKSGKDVKPAADIKNAKHNVNNSHRSNSIVKDSHSTRPTKAYPAPPPSAFPRSSSTNPTTARRSRQATFPPSSGSAAPSRRRATSLSEKFPGDMSHRPLDTLRKEKYVADRSRHSTRSHQIRPDTIDSLDDAAPAAYHHSGPYDSTLFARNNCANSPLAALADSNAEALKATPVEKIIDSVQGHHPLDGVAAYAPGETDRNGHKYEYEQGENMMIADGAGGGAYKRWPGIQYDPDDIKGKGEPSYSIEKALKEASLENKNKDEEGIELTSTHTHHHHHHNLLHLPLRRHSEKGRRLSRSGGQSGKGAALVTTTTASSDETSNSLLPHRSGSFKTLRKRIGSMGKAD